jgi:hypothetical protein
VRDDRHGNVSPRIGFVDRERPLGRILGLGPGLVRRHKPIVLVHVVESQAAVSQGIVGIDRDSLIKVVDARVKLLLGEFIGVVLAFQIKPVGSSPTFCTSIALPS